MADFSYKNVTVTGAETAEKARRQAIEAYLQQLGKPTEQDITALVAEVEAEEAERVDLSDLGQKIATELEYLNTTIADIDSYTAGEVRGVVKRLCQENRSILRALRFVVRRMTN